MKNEKKKVIKRFNSTAPKIKFNLIIVIILFLLLITMTFFYLKYINNFFSVRSYYGYGRTFYILDIFGNALLSLSRIRIHRRIFGRQGKQGVVFAQSI